LNDDLWKGPSHPSTDDDDAEDGADEDQNGVKRNDFVRKRISDEDISPTDVIKRCKTAKI